jgi:hypothetical protein
MAPGNTQRNIAVAQLQLFQFDHSLILQLMIYKKEKTLSTVSGTSVLTGAVKNAFFHYNPNWIFLASPKQL